MIERENQSPFERRAYAYIERGYSVIPIAPGTKRPGMWTEQHGWRGMQDWERFNQRLPSDIELDHWYKWPGAGIGLLCGKLSKIVALDRDYDTKGTDALEAIIPWTPVKKKGAKGYTAFFRYQGEKSCSFNIGGVRVLDVLSDGRQTLMPGTIHPDGHTYVYLTEDLLEDYDPEDLPVLPANFFDRVREVLAPYQTDEDRKFERKPVVDTAEPINTDLSFAGQYYRDLNQAALARLDEWVPKLIENTRRERDGYRCVASWRGGKNFNVGIHPSGIKDFKAEHGLTPIDLVLYQHGLTVQRAAELLRGCLAMHEPEPITFAAAALPAPSATPVTPPAPVTVESPKPVTNLMPWVTAKANPPAVQLPPTTSLDPAPALPAFLVNPPGILGVITRWITSTAPKSQHELALASAIALCGTVMARTYRSQYGNWTSMYFVLVAKSTEGKEHPQRCVEKALTAAEMTELIGGSGYTSAGAVYSALLKHPAHIATVDEIGKLLKLSRSKGQANTEAAIDKLVEAFGRQDGVLRPPTYSTMTLSAAQAATTQRMIQNPGITLLGATTPGTWYGSLTDDLVHDGFTGRLIVVESKEPRQLTRFVDRTDPPQQVVDWMKAVRVTAVVPGNLAGTSLAELPPVTVEFPFAESCLPVMRAFEEELNAAKDKYESEGLDVLLGRTLEKALKVAMVVAKAVDPNNRQVLPEHLAWAIDYIRFYDMAMIRAVRKQRVRSNTDGDIKKALTYITNAVKYSKDARYGSVCAQGVMPHGKLLKLMAMPSRQFKEMMDTAVEAYVIKKSPGIPFGYPAGDVYMAGDVEAEED